MARNESLLCDISSLERIAKSNKLPRWLVNSTAGEPGMDECRDMPRPAHGQSVAGL